MSEDAVPPGSPASEHDDPTLPLTALEGGRHDHGRNSGALLQIANAMVRIYKDAFGRGPTKARAQFAGPDILLVILQDSMTVVERNLAAMGEHGRLRDARLFFQYALEDEFRATVERILGRRTVAFMSGIDTRRDVSVEVFTLEPRPAPDAVGARTWGTSSAHSSGVRRGCRGAAQREILRAMPVVTADPEPLAIDELGWRQFLDLCTTVLELQAGVPVEAWQTTADRRWHCSIQAELRLGGRAVLPAPCHLQAVWIPERTDATRSAALAAELSALKAALEPTGESVAVISNYAGRFSDRAHLSDFLEREHAALLGPGWLSQRVDADPGLRRTMPSLLGLGDLARWVSPQLVAASTLDLRAARALAEVFVPTAAYRRALTVLDAHRFVVLTGPPEMGKTSIARMIALALMTDGWEAFECTSPEQILGAFKPDRAQVFVADDAFGSTEYRPDHAERWAREMERLLRKMNDRHWLIWTSRPAPLRGGLDRIHRERGAERFPRPGEVLVDAGSLSLDERVLILLRHAGRRSVRRPASVCARSATRSCPIPISRRNGFAGWSRAMTTSRSRPGNSSGSSSGTSRLRPRR